MPTTTDYKILSVVEDTSILELVSDVFSHAAQSYILKACPVGTKAIDEIEETEPDIVLIDISVPVDKAFALLTELKSYDEFSGIPVVAMLNDINCVEQLFDLGVSDFIKKPLDRTELLVRVKSVLSMRRLIVGISSQTEELEMQSYRLVEQKRQLEEEKRKSDELLKNILPYEIAEQLKNKGKVDAKKYRRASIMFTDFKGFSNLSAQLEPEEIIQELGIFFAKFDEIIDLHFIEKIKTIGDAYMCVGGLPLRNKSNPIDTTLAGLEIQRFVRRYNEQRKSEGLPVWELRLGIHTGPVIAGVIGTKKFAYDIWGDAVNTASRMETSAEPGRVNISGVTYNLIEEFFDCEYRGKIAAKNIGEIDMYYVNGLKVEFQSPDDPIKPNEHFKEILASF
jgi:class 3 adenylate cyclase/CheY-like chemotaxis protein